MKKPRYTYTKKSQGVGAVLVDSGTVSLAFRHSSDPPDLAQLYGNDSLHSLVGRYAQGWSGTLWNSETQSGIIKNPDGDGTCSVVVCQVVVTLDRRARWPDLGTWNPDLKQPRRDLITFFVARAKAGNARVSPNGEDAVALAAQRVNPETLTFAVGDCGRCDVTGQVTGHCIQIQRDEHRNGTLTIYGITYQR